MKHQGLDHFAIVVPSTDDALKIWRDRLGFPAVCSEAVNAGTDAPGALALGENTWAKVAILGHPDGWTWDTHADRGPPHPDTPVCRVFAAPGTCRLEFADRSHDHAIDRFVLRKVSSPRPRLKPAEEKRSMRCR